MRVLPLGLLICAMAGLASAAHSRPKLVSVVKHEGAFTATLTAPRGPHDLFTGVTLQIERGGRVLLRKKICPLDPYFRKRCQWILVAAPPSLSVRRVGPGGKPAFVVEDWNGGNQCCIDTFIAIPGRKVAWLTREWAGAKGWSWYRIHRVRNQCLFVTGDGRFFCVFSACAGASVPIRIFRINSRDRFVNVTRSFPDLIRADAGRQAGPIRQQGSGVLAAWCGDEYLLGQGRDCARVLAYVVKHHRKNMFGDEPNRAFVRQLNRDLVRWDYKSG